ncbi:MAG: hypothetical protein ACT4QD_12005 [Acidobacteriota bacterium]
MEVNKLVFGGLVAGCLAAAGLGGYIAARQGAAPSPAEPQVFTPVSPAPGEVTPSSPTAVAESEGIITPEAPQAVPADRAATRAAQAPAPAPRASRTPDERRAAATPAARPRPARPAPVAQPAEPQVATAPQPGGGMWEMRPAVEPERAPAIVEPEAPPAPPEPEFVDLVVPADAVLGLQIERLVSSETAKVEDLVEARLTRDVRVGDRVAIPAGALVRGAVMEVERGGKVKERARLGIRFHTVVLADGTRLNIRTDAVVREGPSPSGESAAKIGGAAVGGAILGAIFGGAKGAAIGGSVGAAGGTAATMAGGRNPAILPAGSTVSVRVQQPVTVTVEK